jgi:hypothetical protein
MCTGGYLSEVKLPEREIFHSPPYGAEVKNTWIYTSTLPQVFMALCLVKHKESLTSMLKTVFCGKYLDIFGHMGVELAEDWRRLHNEQLHNLHTSPNIVRMMKSRKMR